MVRLCAQRISFLAVQNFHVWHRKLANERLISLKEGS